MVVSAIMIIIVMYISVMERTQEIGILRSIGARKKDILKIFITEATMLGGIGGIFGVALAYIIATITNIISDALSNLAPILLVFLLFLAVNPSSISDIPQ